MGPLVARVEPYALVGLSPGTHLGMPSAHLTLVLTLDAPLELSGGPRGPDRHRLRVCLAGLHTTPVSIHHEGRMRGIQLALTSAGCRALLACPAGEFAKCVVEGARRPRPPSPSGPGRAPALAVVARALGQLTDQVDPERAGSRARHSSTCASCLAGLVGRDLSRGG